MQSAEQLRGLAASFVDTNRAVVASAQQEAGVVARERVDTSVHAHFDAARLGALMVAMRHTAEAGGGKQLALRFPSDACTDGGRKINTGEEGWGDTLRGEAADVFTLWKSELEPQGYQLKAETLDYVDGMPGDVGLTVVWARA